MADVVLSNKADEDLTEIYLYSHRTFGEAAADAYLAGLSDSLQALADDPRRGRPAADLQDGLLWHRHARHLIFYLKETTGIFVVRVLHEAMDFPRHLGPTGEDRA